MTFDELNLSTPLRNAISDLGFVTPTPIQEKSFSVIMSGRDMVGIAQTGTGKTIAYMLPILRLLPFSRQENPRVLVLVPTRELVLQVVEETEKLAAYSNLRVLGVYGGTNINTQKKAIAEGLDIIVATPGRLYDLAVSRVLQLKSIQKLVIDEVDVMLDLGFRHQLVNIFDILPHQRQNILFSATMTEDVEELLSVFFKNPEKVSVALSGEPLKNIDQSVYHVPNFYTKVNLLLTLLSDRETYFKVLLFVKNKKTADLLFELLDEHFKEELCVIHSNKTQNYRIRSIRQFEAGENRILIATDVMARGLDFENISHVINVDTPDYPENYIHRIGRTGRAERTGNAVVLTTPNEENNLEAIESLMQLEVTRLPLPKGLEISEKLTYEERPVIKEINNPGKRNKNDEDAPGPAFHDKKDKNKKENLGGSYRREIAKKYKKPLTKGDKNYNRRNKKK
ncbi:MAG: DEAD/DEAH box helicase [Flavobacteriaceae bacterium]